jgi:hypothetical protein
MTEAAPQSPSSFGAGDDRVTVKLSPHSVTETVDRFTALIADKGLQLFTVTKRYSLSDELAAKLAGISALTDAMTV